MTKKDIYNAIATAGKNGDIAIYSISEENLINKLSISKENKDSFLSIIADMNKEGSIKKYSFKGKPQIAQL